MLPVFWLHAADHHYSVKGPTVVGPCPEFSEEAVTSTSFDADSHFVTGLERSFAIQGTGTDIHLP